MNTWIRTVLGDIDPADLGWCQCHEHLLLADGPSRRISGALYMPDYDKALAELKLYSRAGGKSMVDAQPYGCGRMAEETAQASKASGVHIIACTGFHKTEFLEESVLSRGGGELSHIYANEVWHGMMGADGGRMKARAGIVKCAAVAGEMDASPAYAVLFEAAAQAASQTGAPVMVHTDKGADALRILAYFEQFGILPGQVMICHMDRSYDDIKVHEQVAESGAYLEYDTIHRLKYRSDEQEIDLIAHMVERGHGGQLLLGMDTTNERLKSYGADFGTDFILETFQSRLAERIGAQMVETIMVKNPARALAMSVEI